MAQLEEATQSRSGENCIFRPIAAGLLDFKVKECFENVPSSFWWNLETFGQPDAKISVILHQRVCGIFHPEGGPAGAEFRAGGARAFIEGTKNSRERVTHTTQWTETRHGRCAVLRWGRLSIKHQARQERCAILRRDRLRTRNLKRICWLRM